MNLPLSNRIVESLRAKGCNPSHNEYGWTAKCPAHQDSGVSLSIQGTKISCKNGCTPRMVLESLGLIPSSAREDKWPELTPLVGSDLPDFPDESLPPALGDWVRAESIATQTPVALPALLSLAVISSTMARRVVVCPTKGYVEPTNLFIAVLLPPANRKSAVFRDALKPLKAIEKELIESKGPEIAQALSQRRQDDMRLSSLEKKAIKSGCNESQQQALSLAAELQGQPVIAMPRLIVDDATCEYLAVALRDQGGRIASMSAEGGVFDLMAGKYSKNGETSFSTYLMGHAGDDLRVDRISRPAISVERPALTCAYAIQPNVIEGMATNPAFRGRGLLGRFLYFAPRSWIGSREVSPPPVPDETVQRYEDLVRSIDEEAKTGNVTLNLSESARVRFESWKREVELNLGEDGEMETFTDWGGKLVGATLRIASVIHACNGMEWSRRPISSGSLSSAIAIARSLIPHAEVVLTQVMAAEDPKVENARYLLRWIERKEISQFSQREAHRAAQKKMNASDTQVAIKVLVEHGYIRTHESERKTGTGRSPSPVYEVRPKEKSDRINRKNGKSMAEISVNSVHSAGDGQSGPETVIL